MSATRFATPGGWTGNTSTSVSRLGMLAGHNIGPNVLQKVMAGDLITATADYYESSAGGNSANVVSAVAGSLLEAISGSAGASSLVKANAGAITNQLENLAAFGAAVQPNGSNPGGTRPQAFITILFFDERFNLVESGNGVTQYQVDASVGADGRSFDPLSAKAPKNGYVYVYLSNQSDNPVYFDEFKVGIRGGNIVEENHYYTYGLKIAGISSRKYGTADQGHLRNNYLYQGAFAELDEATTPVVLR